MRPELAQREVGEAWTAALEGAGLPLSPSTARTRTRPRISFGAPLPVGMAAEGELIDVVLVERWPVWRVREALTGRLPAGWRLVDLFDVWLAGPPLAGRVAAADYRITLAAAVGRGRSRAGSRGRSSPQSACRASGQGQRAPSRTTFGRCSSTSSIEPGPPALVRTRTRFHPELGTGRPEEVVAALRDMCGAPLEIDSIVRERLRPRRRPVRIDDRPQRDRSSLLGLAVALSVLSIGINGVLGGTAILVGLASGSLSLLGFGLDAAIDSAASVVLVWRFRTEVREPHRAERIEALAETAVGVVMFVLAAFLGVSAIGALASNAQPEPSDIRTVLLVVALLVLPPLAIAKHRVARRLGSGALRADSILTAIAAVLALIGLSVASARRAPSCHLGRRCRCPCHRGDHRPRGLGVGAGGPLERSTRALSVPAIDRDPRSAVHSTVRVSAPPGAIPCPTARSPRASPAVVKKS